jgi:hypothetical protein
LITSCQVSEKPNSGPVIAQTATTDTAVMKATGCPVAWAVALAKREKGDGGYGRAMQSSVEPNPSIMNDAGTVIAVAEESDRRISDGNLGHAHLANGGA